MRSHALGELGKKHEGAQVTLCGWVDRRRDHGSLIFVDLRDRYGIAQIVLDLACHPGLEKQGASTIRIEEILKVQGKVRLRDAESVRKENPTGEVEVEVSDLVFLARVPQDVKNLPVPTGTSADVDAKKGKETDEEVRMQFRYLDLRRPSLQQRIMLRHRICSAFRSWFDSRGFVDVETPFLTKSTPEGSRDYLVPSRIHPGHFYALPQSPQLFKQLLMVGGFDRYYQIVRCFRDEDLRKDRQPEFTQLDLEMTFVTEEDVLREVEGAVEAACHAAASVLEPSEPARAKGLRAVKAPFRRITFQEALLKYGSDKPDLRFALEIVDVTAECAKAEGFLKEAATATRTLPGGKAALGGAARALRVPESAEKFSRKDLDSLASVVSDKGIKGVAWLKVVGEKGAKGKDRAQTSLGKLATDELVEALLAAVGGVKGDLVLLIANQKERTAAEAMGLVRLHVAEKLGLREKEPARMEFVWAVEFPLFCEDPNREGGYAPESHPFTDPRPEDMDKLESDPLLVRSRHYDLVLNGTELGSGSVRIHTPELQKRIFGILGLSEEVQKRRFGFLLSAFRYGAPPHGGIALGVDRFCAMLSKTPSIRDVIAFPKTNRATDPMTDAPSIAEAEQLGELHIQACSPPPPKP
ncbi:aspartate--tRNA ligase [bacterium]|nr:aspartate--tRNA ligase [bacterium]